MLGMLPIDMQAWGMEYKLDKAWQTKNEDILGVKITPLSETFANTAARYDKTVAA